MIEPKLLALLRCPLTGEPLECAEITLIERLNAAIGEGQLSDAQDQKIGQPVEGGVITVDRKRLYPICGGIPKMIGDESILLDQLGDRDR